NRRQYETPRRRCRAKLEMRSSRATKTCSCASRQRASNFVPLRFAAGLLRGGSDRHMHGRATGHREPSPNLPVAAAEKLHRATPPKPKAKLRALKKRFATRNGLLRAGIQATERPPLAVPTWRLNPSPAVA